MRPWRTTLDENSQLLDVAVERPALDQLKVEVGRTLEDRVHSGLTGDHREDCHLDTVDQTGAISARFIDRLPCERNGTLDSSLSQTTSSPGPICAGASATCRALLDRPKRLNTPQLVGAIGKLIPPGAGGNLLRSTAFFDGAAASGHAAVLAAWVFVGMVALGAAPVRHRQVAIAP
jgi:hypothetical protein